MSDEDPILDWTDPRWLSLPVEDRVSRVGIPYPVLMTPQGAAKILNKAAKKGVIGGKGKSKTVKTVPTKK